MTDGEQREQFAILNTKLDGLTGQFREYLDRHDREHGRIQETIRDIQKAAIDTEKNRKSTCPKALDIAASAKGVNEIRDAVETLEKAPADAALAAQTDIKKQVRTAIVASGLTAIFAYGKSFVLWVQEGIDALSK